MKYLPLVLALAFPVVAVSADRYPAPTVSSREVACVWNPQPDITAFELAQWITYLTNRAPLTNEAWLTLNSAQRHCTRTR